MALKASAFMKKSGKQPKKEQKGSKSDKLIAWIGDRRHGVKKMGEMAAKGKERD